MSTTQYVKSPVKASQLLQELNFSPDITSTALEVDYDSSNSTVLVHWNQTLQSGEPPIAAAIVNAHVPEEESVDVSLLPFNVGKLYVHSSSKPNVEGKTFYDVFTGRGDCPDDGTLGDGPLCVFNFDQATPSGSPAAIPSRSQIHHMEFIPSFGEVWLHGGYFSYVNAGVGDTITAYIMAGPSLVTDQLPSKQLVVDGEGWITAAVGSPNPGTHDFAATPNLIPRTFSQDGDWDYDGTNLIPNLSGTGLYKININEKPVNRYVDDVPIIGSSNGYVKLGSSEAAHIPSGYHIDVVVTNVSGNAMQVAAIAQIYRERTFQP
jgi:hypothetical protein